MNVRRLTQFINNWMTKIRINHYFRTFTWPINSSLNDLLQIRAPQGFFLNNVVETIKKSTTYWQQSGAHVKRFIRAERNGRDKRSPYKWVSIENSFEFWVFSCRRVNKKPNGTCHFTETRLFSSSHFVYFSRFGISHASPKAVNIPNKLRVPFSTHTISTNLFV